MTIHRTRWVTFPRSGHHWAVRLIQSAIPEIVYEEHHSTGKTLENSPEVHLQKTHDFDLSVPVSPEFRHIVQVRDFVKSMESWRKLDSTKNVLEMQNYYHCFILKWVIKDVPNRIVVHYSDLMVNTRLTLFEMLNHVADCERLAAWTAAGLAAHLEPCSKRP